MPRLVKDIIFNKKHQIFGVFGFKLGNLLPCKYIDYF